MIILLITLNLWLVLACCSWRWYIIQLSFAYRFSQGVVTWDIGAKLPAANWLVDATADRRVFLCPILHNWISHFFMLHFIPFPNTSGKVTCMMFRRLRQVHFHFIYPASRSQSETWPSTGAIPTGHSPVQCRYSRPLVYYYYSVIHSLSVLFISYMKRGRAEFTVWGCQKLTILLHWGIFVWHWVYLSLPSSPRA